MEKLLCLIFLSVFISSSLTQKEDGEVCPKPTSYVNVCRMLCYGDEDCRGTKKCCDTLCGGSVCVEPLRNPREDSGKEGNCPRPSGPWVCSSRCRTDDDCRGTRKCCKNRCGALACMIPEREPYY